MKANSNVRSANPVAGRLDRNRWGLTNICRALSIAAFQFLFISGAGAAACPLMYCAIDLKFSTQQYSGCDTLEACLKFGRSSVKWARWRDGHYSLFDVEKPAITDLGLLLEPKAANYLRYSRDLTNPAWSKANVVATKTAVGIDNAANAATTLTATRENGAVSQAISLGEGQRSLSLFMRRRTGAGLVSISYDGGATFIPCSLTQEFQRFSAGLDALKNPEVVIRLDVAGDSIDVDFVQVEDQRFVTSPILTEAEAPVLRSADQSSIVGSAVAPLNSGSFSFVIEGEGTEPREYGRAPVEIIAGQTASFFTVPSLSKLVMMHHREIGKDMYAPLGWGISPLLAQGSMARHFKFAASSSEAKGTSLVADGGPIVRHTKGVGKEDSSWRLGADGLYSGYLARLTIWNAKLEDETLQWLTRVDIPAANIADARRGLKNLAVRDRVNLNGGLYEVQSGIQNEPVTGTHAAQISPGGNYLKFNMFANNAWAIDGSDPADGTERVELSGSVPGSTARFLGNETDSIWVSDAFYIEKGDPITTDWVTLGQIHDRVGIGPVLAFSLRHGDYMAVGILGEGFYKTIGKYPITRGKWYNRVFNVKFNQAGDGFVKVWINGTKVADYHGKTGNANTQYYYWKFGIYRSHASEYMAVRYANVRTGSADLSALIANPDPLPNEVCDDGSSC